MRVGVVLLLALVLAGCVTTAENTLSPERRAALKIESVKVTFAPGALLNWSEVESEFDRSKNPNDGIKAYVTAVPMTGDRRAYVEKKAAARIADAFEKKVLPAFRGTEPARVEVIVKALDLPSGLKRALIGGQHRIEAEITVVNARTGQTIIRAPDFQSQHDGGGVVSLVGDMVLPDPIDRASIIMANSYKSWLESGWQLGRGML
jgi:hypothetical protein